MRRWPGCTRSSTPIDEEFDDYIARPKANGYQSLHTVVRDATAGRQADRDPDPHRRRCTTTPSTAWPRTGPTRRRAARAMPACRPAASTTPRSRCCASCWRGSATCPAARRAQGLFDDRIYVLTPDAAIVELPQGATPVDFAYTRAHQPGPPLPRRAGRRRDGAAQHAAAERPDGGDHRGQGGRARRATGSMRNWAILASHRAAPRCGPGSTRRSRTRPWRAAARRSRSCCSAKARRR